jgi:hypothetical protein
MASVTFSFLAGLKYFLMHFLFLFLNPPSQATEQALQVDHSENSYLTLFAQLLPVVVAVSHRQLPI